MTQTIANRAKKPDGFAAFDFLALAEVAAARGKGCPAASRELGICEMVKQAVPVASDRAGLALPTRELLRDLQLSTPSGGNLAGAVQSPMELLAGAARPLTVFDRAGIQPATINGASEGSVPRWRGTGGHWVIEGQSIPPANLTFSTVNVRAFMCGAQITYSRRLRLQTAGDLQNAVITELRQQVRQTLEDGFLNGQGTGGAPLGLLAQAAGSVPFAGVAPVWSEILLMLETLADADGDLSNAVWFVHPSTAVGMMATLQAAGSDDTLAEFKDGQWLIGGLPAFPSTMIPEGTLILLDRRAVVPVFFGPPMLLADPYSGSNSITGNTTIIVSNYADLAVPEPALVVVGR